jgi:hypothetical protein
VNEREQLAETVTPISGRCGEPDRFAIAGDGGSRLDYLVRRENDVWVYSRDLDSRMDISRTKYREGPQTRPAGEERDLERGFTTTLLLLLSPSVRFIRLDDLSSQIA